MKSDEIMPLKQSAADKIELVKQQIAETQRILDATVRPKQNHILFEINLVSGTIVPAEFDKPPVLKWQDAVSGLWSSKKELTKKEGCIYISAMNVDNVKKHLKKRGILLQT